MRPLPAVMLPLASYVNVVLIVPPLIDLTACGLGWPEAG